MKKALLFLTLLLSLYSTAEAKRYVNIKVKLLTPVNGDTLYIGDPLPIYARIYNLGVDTFRATDSAQYVLEFDGSPIFFNSDTSLPPTPYLPISEMEILPGDSTIFGFDFTVFQGWPLGNTNICVSFIPYNAVDSIVDTIMNNNTSCSTIKIFDTPTSVSGNVAVNEQNLTIYPNPAISKANLKFDLKKNADVAIQIFDLSGRVVAEQKHNSMTAGAHEIEVNTSTLNAGLYICKVKLGDTVITRKLQIVTP